MKSGTALAPQRVKDAQSDTLFETAALLRERAVQLAREGRVDECSRVLELAAHEITATGVIEERPRQLCEIARCFSDIGRPDRADETLNTALEMLEEVREESPWKFTNYLCYVACERIKAGSSDAPIRRVIDRAISSLPDIDAHYQKRRVEILSRLSELSRHKRLQPLLTFHVSLDSVPQGIPTLPLTQDVESMCATAFLSEEELEGLRSAAEGDASDAELSGAVSGVQETWRRAVALAIASRMLPDESDARRVSDILSLALDSAASVRFYWVQDSALEAISGVYVEKYSLNSDEAFLRGAHRAASLIKDPWKQSRAFCRIAWVLLDKKRFEEAARHMNHVHSNLLEKIDYRERTAMSMLLIAEVLGKMADKRRGIAWLGLFDSSGRRAKRLRMEARSILDSLESGKREASMKEYDDFISLRARW